MAESQDVLSPRAVTRDIFSATIGSVFCCYTGQPFDTVKVRMQTPDGVEDRAISLDDVGAADFLRSAVQSDGLMTIHTEEATLEAIFIEMTGRGLEG